MQVVVTWGRSVNANSFLTGYYRTHFVPFMRLTGRDQALYGDKISLVPVQLFTYGVGLSVPPVTLHGIVCVSLKPISLRAPEEQISIISWIYRSYPKDQFYVLQGILPGLVIMNWSPIVLFSRQFGSCLSRDIMLIFPPHYVYMLTWSSGTFRQ